MSRSTQTVPGQFSLVLHTHLPWLAHHGRWPVGEEWLYQSWAAFYLPLMRVLRTLPAENRQVGGSPMTGAASRGPSSSPKSDRPTIDTLPVWAADGQTLVYSDAPLVSIDFNHSSASAHFDATLTRVTGPLVKACAWYDNEWGFSNRMLDVAIALMNAP